MSQMTELVRQAKSGDARAFARLYETIYKDMYRFAVYTLRSTQDAEDAVSEAVLDAFAQIGSLREPDAFKSWMFRILTAKCSRRIRQYADAPCGLSEEIHDTSPDIVLRADIHRALESLPDEDRMILSLSLFAGYSSQETGDLLGMNANTVRSRQSRALKKLGTILKE